MSEPSRTSYLFTLSFKFGDLWTTTTACVPWLRGFITETNTVIDLARTLEGHWLVASLQGYATTDVDIGVFNAPARFTNGVWGCPTTLFVSGTVVPTIVSSKTKCFHYGTSSCQLGPTTGKSTEPLAGCRTPEGLCNPRGPPARG